MIQQPTRVQLKMARYALGLDLLGVSAETKLSTQTITNLEALHRDSKTRPVTLLHLANFYTTKGIEFGPDGWVRLKPKPTPQTSPTSEIRKESPK
jgi:hypothetical protein